MVLNRLPADLKSLYFPTSMLSSAPSGWIQNGDLTCVVRCYHLFYNLAAPILYSPSDSTSKVRSVDLLRHLTIRHDPTWQTYCQYLSGLLQDCYLYTMHNSKDWPPDNSLLFRLGGLKDTLWKGCDDKSLRKMVRVILFQPKSLWWTLVWSSLKLRLDPNLLILPLPNISTLMLPIFGIGRTYKLEFLSYNFARASRLKTLNVSSMFSLRQLRNIEITVSQ
jgi:hypothetical protein